jgi:hypothetical protein
VVPAAQHRLGDHCHNGLWISVLFADSDDLFDISRLLIPDADVDGVAHVGHRQSFTLDLRTSLQVFPSAQDLSPRCAAAKA